MTLARPPRQAANEHRVSAILLYLAWATVGLALALALVTPFTIGLFVAPFALGALGLLAARPAARDASAFGLLCGPGILALYIAYLNRGGPGEVCTSTASSQSCQSQWNPWPIGVVGVAMLVGSVVCFWHTTFRREPAA
jgi:hypothetical protein